jgi:hypothetical protein
MLSQEIKLREDDGVETYVSKSFVTGEDESDAWTDWIDVLRFDQSSTPAPGWRKSPAGVWKIRSGDASIAYTKTIPSDSLNFLGIYEWRCTVAKVGGSGGSGGSGDVVFYAGCALIGPKGGRNSVKDRIDKERSLQSKTIGKPFRDFVIAVYEQCVTNEELTAVFKVRALCCKSPFDAETKLLSEVDYACNVAKNPEPRVHAALEKLRLSLPERKSVDGTLTWEEIVAALNVIRHGAVADDLAVALNQARRAGHRVA